MSPEYDALAVAEYRALRETIRQRGSIRLVLAPVTFVAWALLVLLVTATTTIPALALVPLLVLAAGFEAVFAVHVGVERIGRYLQAFYEPGLPQTPAWEHVAMAGAPISRRGARIDPLFASLFAAATLLNFIPVVILTGGQGPLVPGGVPLEIAVYGLLHLLLLWRIVGAWRFAARQRGVDLAHFKALKSPGRQD